MAVTSILNNVAALGASYELGITGTGMQDTIQRLTTGKRINQASDDPSGLVIANNLTSSTQIDTQGQANANNALSQLQTQDGYLSEATNLLTRAAELAQEAQGSNVDTSALQAEFASIQSTFADLISGQSGNTLSTALGSFGGLGFSITTINNAISAGVDLNNSGDAATAATAIGTTLASLGSARGDIGAAEESLQSYSNVLGISMQNQTSQLSQVQDANIADEVVNLTKYQILNQSGISALSKANQAGQSILTLLQ
jgi:flagellin